MEPDDIPATDLGEDDPTEDEPIAPTDAETPAESLPDPRADIVPGS